MAEKIPQEKIDKLNDLIRKAHKKWPAGECNVCLSLSLPLMDRIEGSMSFEYKCYNYPEVDRWGIDKIIEFLENKVGRMKPGKRKRKT